MNLDDADSCVSSLDPSYVYNLLELMFELDPQITMMAKKMYRKLGFKKRGKHLYWMMTDEYN